MLWCKKFWFCIFSILCYISIYICRGIVTQPNHSSNSHQLFIVYNNFHSNFDKVIVKKSYPPFIFSYPSFGIDSCYLLCATQCQYCKYMIKWSCILFSQYFWQGYLKANFDPGPFYCNLPYYPLSSHEIKPNF